MTRNTRHKGKVKVVAFTAITVLMLMGTMFYSTTEVQAKTWWSDYAIIAGSAGTGAGIGALVADGPGAVVGAAIGALGGFLYLGWSQGSAENALSAQAQDALAHQNYIIQRNQINTTIANGQNMYNMYNLSKYFFVRKGEYGAQALYQRQKANNENFTYDGDEILSESNVSKDMLIHLYGSAQDWTNVLSNYGTYGDYFFGGYSGMSIQILGIYGAYEKGKILTDYTHQYKIVNLYRITNEKYYHFTNYPVYLYAVKNGTYTIQARDVDGNLVNLYYDDGNYKTRNYTLSYGDIVKFNVSDTEGTKLLRFNITLGGSSPVYTDMALLTYAAPAVTQTTGPIYPAFVGYEYDKDTGTISTTTGYYYTNDILSIADSDGLWYTIDGGYWLKDVYSTGVYQISLLSIFEWEQRTISLLSNMATTVNVYAKTTYDALVNGAMDATLLPVDVIFPDPSQLEGINATDLYAMYMAYLRSLYDEMQNTTHYNFNQQNISLESFKNLRIVGSIRNATGVYKVGTNTTSAVFVPYISIKDMHLQLGENIMNQSGFALVLNRNWQNNTTTQDMPISALDYVPLEVGDTLTINSIEIQGQAVNETNLTVTKFEYIIPSLAAPSAPPTWQDLPDAIINWIKAHMLTSGLAGLGFALLLVGRSKTVPILLFAAAAVSYFYIEPNLNLASLLNLTISQITYWRW